MKQLHYNYEKKKLNDLLVILDNQLENDDDQTVKSILINLT